MARRKSRRGGPKGAGSTTNASEAMDDVALPPKPTSDEAVDEGVMETFPASDPVSVSQPKSTAHERMARGEEPPVPPPLPKRSPDWMLEKK